MVDYFLISDIISYNQARYMAFKNGEYFEENKDYERILNARYCKVSRIKKRVVYLFSYYKYIYFCTFTFDNDLLSKCDRTKRDYIKHALSSFDNDVKYILNVDYGHKNEREHYHCIVATNNNGNLRNHLKKEYPCLSGCDKVNMSCKDLKCIAKYINKLTNHCIKKETKNKRIIYNFKDYYSSLKELGRIEFILDSHKLGL